ncbi:unnamed protein product [Amoebophrya sp. A25]|nr:unnamed protein product [Amoebophrya sp. A25]|eukprot:GSA25T00017727001.1
MTSSSSIIILRGAAGRALVCPLVVVGWAIYSSVTAGGGQVAADKNLRGTHSAGHKHQSDVDQSAKTASTLIEKQGKHSDEREHAVANHKALADGMDGKDSESTPKEHVKNHSVLQLDQAGKHLHHQGNGKQGQKHSKPAEHSPPHGAGGAVVHKSKTLAGDGVPKPIFAAGTSVQHDEENWHQFGGFVFVKILCALTMGLWLPIVLASPYVRAHFPKILAEDQGRDALGCDELMPYLTPTPLFAAFLQSTSWLILLLVATSDSRGAAADWRALPSALLDKRIMLEVCALFISLGASLTLIVAYPFICDGKRRADATSTASSTTRTPIARPRPATSTSTSTTSAGVSKTWHNFSSTYFAGVLVCAVVVALICIAEVRFVRSPHTPHSYAENPFFFVSVIRCVSLVSTVILFREASFGNVFGGSYFNGTEHRVKNLTGTFFAIVMTCAWFFHGRFYLDSEFGVYLPCLAACLCYIVSLLIRAFLLPLPAPDIYTSGSSRVLRVDSTSGRSRMEEEVDTTTPAPSSSGSSAEASSAEADEADDDETTCLRQECQEYLREENDIARGRFVKLSNLDRASRFACHVPAIFTFSLTLAFAITWFWSQITFIYLITAATCVLITWSMYMQTSALVGLLKLRKACTENWGQKWDSYLAANPGIDEGLIHFVMIPNYKEGEAMLAQTLENIANNRLAKKYMVCVLAMEEREGDAAREKAERLIARHAHLFKDMFATYHPADLPGEVKGKSGNAQWAFREIQAWHSRYLMNRRNKDKLDDENEMSTSSTSSVYSSGKNVKDETAGKSLDKTKAFLTAVDADSIHHKEYFANLTLNALQMTEEERFWTIWQPPILHWRNWNTVPRLVRNSAYGTLCFELSGCVTAPVWDHMSFSTYTMTLALASHPAVDGWDVEVSTDDHHMYLQSFCASHWEALSDEESNRSIRSKSKLKLETLYTPVMAYLPEDDRGHLYTIYARFLQSRRHLQGIAENAYLLLQYFTITFTSREPLPFLVHLQFIGVLMKYGTLAVLTTVHFLITSVLSIVGLVILVAGSCQTGFVGNFVTEVSVAGKDGPVFGAMCILIKYAFAVFLVSSVATNSCAVRETLSGMYCPLYYLSASGKNRYAADREQDEIDEEQVDHRKNEGDRDNVKARFQNDEVGSKGEVNDIEEGEALVCEEDDVASATEYGVVEPNTRGNVFAVEPSSTREQLMQAKSDGKKILPLTRKLTFWEHVKIVLEVLVDICIFGHLGILCFCAIPLFLAVTHISIYGHTFDFVVAPKPEAATGSGGSPLALTASGRTSTANIKGENAAAHKQGRNQIKKRGTERASISSASTSLDGSTANGSSDGSSSHEDEKIIAEKSKIMRKSYGSVY